MPVSEVIQVKMDCNTYRDKIRTQLTHISYMFGLVLLYTIHHRSKVQVQNDFNYAKKTVMSHSILQCNGSAMASDIYLCDFYNKSFTSLLQWFGYNMGY